MLKKLAMLVGLAVVVILGLAFTKPDSFRVERRLVIQAPPEKVFAQLQDFHRWAAWSPWEKLDPAMNRSFSGAEAGVGAVYAWKGNDDVGAGRMEVIEATAPSKVAIKLDFIAPFEGHNRTDFNLTPVAGGVDVSWVMTGPSVFVTKLMQVFTSMDKMIGKDFEAGLANLKRVAEAP